MDIPSTPVTLYAGHTPLAVIDQRLFALLDHQDQAEQWVITPVPQHGDDAVIIETHDHAAGMVLPNPQPGTQVTVQPLIAGRSYPPTFPPHEVWIATPLTNDDNLSPEPHTTAFALRPQSADPDQHIGRSPVEEASMLPKPIVLLPGETEPTPFTAIPTPLPE
jgi:hypothetical protein